MSLCLAEGYERYNAMRADPDLCFLERVGMPDVTALSVDLGARPEGSAETTDRCCFTPQSLSHSPPSSGSGTRS